MRSKVMPIVALGLLALNCGSACGAAGSPAGTRHVRDFMAAAAASRGRPVADIEQGHISTASCILANLAMKLGRQQGRMPPKPAPVANQV